MHQRDGLSVSAWVRDVLSRAPSAAARARQRGQGLVEYAFILILVAVVVIVILSVVGAQTQNAFSNISNGVAH